MPKTQNRLGKGLSALIAPRPASAINQQRIDTLIPPLSDRKSVSSLNVDRIKPNPKQPRMNFAQNELAELAESIKANGVLQPILVRPDGDHSYQLVAGERRLRAAKMAGLREIPAIVRQMTDSASLQIALIENLQREDLGPLERSAAYQQFIDTFDVTADQLAKKLSQSRANITNYMRLLKLGKEIRDMINAGQLGMGQARAIAGVNDPQRQLALARKAVRRNLSVRQVEQLACETPKQRSQEEPQRIAATAHLKDVARALSRATGLKVSLHAGKRKNSGRVVLYYNNLDEFDQLAEKLGAKTTTE